MILRALEIERQLLTRLSYLLGERAGTPDPLTVVEWDTVLCIQNRFHEFNRHVKQNSLQSMEEDLSERIDPIRLNRRELVSVTRYTRNGLKLTGRDGITR